MENRDLLILSFVAYVTRIAHKICASRRIYDWDLREDCISVAMIALVEAVDSYNSAYGATLKTWVSINAAKAVMEQLRQTLGKMENGEFTKKQNLKRLNRFASNNVLLGSNFKNSNDWKEEEIGNCDMVEKILSFVDKTGRQMEKKPDKAEILKLYYVEGYCLREIGERRGCTASNISLIISRAKSDINKKFKGIYKGEEK